MKINGNVGMAMVKKEMTTMITVNQAYFSHHITTLLKSSVLSVTLM